MIALRIDIKIDQKNFSERQPKSVRSSPPWGAPVPSWLSKSVCVICLSVSLCHDSLMHRVKMTSLHCLMFVRGSLGQRVAVCVRWHRRCILAGHRPVRSAGSVAVVWHGLPIPQLTTKSRSIGRAIRADH